MIALLVGARSGLGAVAFRYLIYFFTWLATGHVQFGQQGRVPSDHLPWLGLGFFVVIPVPGGGLIYGPLIYRYAGISLHPRTEQRPVTRWKARSMPRKLRVCPASPETVNHVVSRNWQASPETRGGGLAVQSAGYRGAGPGEVARFGELPGDGS